LVEGALSLIDEVQRGTEMGRSLRIYFLEEDETVKKIPLSKFQRFYDGDRDTAFPDYAGKVVR